MRYSYSAIPIVLGRILLALIFVLAGLEKIFAWSAELGALSARGMPAPDFFLGVALVIELIGGLMLFFGIRTRFAAGVLFLYLIPVTVVMHGFWNATNPVVMQDLLVHFFKNISIMGGLLAVVGYESLIARVSREQPTDRYESGKPASAA